MPQLKKIKTSTSCSFFYVCAALIVFTVTAANGALYAKEKSPFFVYGSVGSAAVVYGDKKTKQQTDAVKAEGTGQFILTAEAGAGFAFNPYIRFAAGALFSSDLCFTSQYRTNRIDYGVSGGFRVYPHLAGFNFGLDYVTGSRVDFIKLPPFSGEGAPGGTPENSAQEVQWDGNEKRLCFPWGNGFRISLAYDFSSLGNKHLPSLEAAWRMMPRGNYRYDHYLSLALRVNTFL